MKTFVRVGMFVVVGALTACTGQEEGRETQEGADVEFLDHFGEQGRLLVVRDFNGNLGISLSDSVKGDRSALLAKVAGLPPAQMFESLHPGQKAPSRLRVLSEEFSNRALKADLGEETALEEVVADKDLSTFNSTVCKNLPTDSYLYYWKKIKCGYQPNPGAPPAAWNYYTGDIAAGWNETAGSAYHDNSNSTWHPVIPPWTYYWTQWNMTNEGAVIEMRRYDPYATSPGYFGVTVHHKTRQLLQPLP